MESHHTMLVVIHQKTDLFPVNWCLGARLDLIAAIWEPIKASYSQSLLRCHFQKAPTYSMSPQPPAASQNSKASFQIAHA